ncbi:M20 family metallopeptidase [Amycolatopsis thermalba]|uniref:Probable succinyl-diaminopimelate desuccinylase n=1 Tax=Amycolatopsis thermalba TaxID=944492 RepID=A0ABY4P110_9PSEU|nr:MULTISPECIES: M20 family metallopeptidase [Amycolatopsis]UQS25968.1 M20 family metallopeptidase [Amycolatopsis thermalba]
MTAEAAAAAVHTGRVTALAAELIRHDTRNPPGGEQPVVEPLVAALRDLGAAIEVFEPVPGRPSVLGHVGSGAGPTLLVNGHIDVVPVVEADWAVPPFGGQVRDGLLYGRGACDMKGGIAAALEGLRACRDAGVVPPATIAFHFVADEETGGRLGTEALVGSGLVKADAAVVPEPSELAVGVAERGVLMAEITVRGRAAHGSDPGVGRSAVADAARIVSALHLADFGGHVHPLLGSPTCNVGTIAGGTAANIVAAECRLRVDRRVLPGQTRAGALAQITRLIDAVGAFDYDTTVLAFAEGSELDVEHPFVAEFRGAAGHAPVRGLKLGTDARFLRNRLGIPAVVYGPGSARVAHTADEYVPVAELVAAARTFARLYATFRG